MGKISDILFSKGEVHFALFHLKEENVLMKSSVGFIGLGMMGTPIAARLQKAGFL